MTLRDGKGAQLHVSNPTAAARLDFTPAADGDYTLQVEHLHLWGGPDEVYRVTVTPYEADFDLRIGLDRFNVAQGGKLSIPILMPRREFDGPIEINVVGPKGISGQLAVAAGKAPPANQPIGTLVVNAAADVPVGPHAFRIQGKATINGKVVTKWASVPHGRQPGTGQSAAAAAEHVPLHRPRGHGGSAVHAGSEARRGVVHARQTRDADDHRHARTRLHR